MTCSQSTKVGSLFAALLAFDSPLCGQTAQDAFPPANSTTVTPITAASGFSFTGTNVGATRQTGEYEHAGHFGGGSVWYLWKPLVSGKVQLTVSPSTASFRPVLAVYQNGTAANGSNAAYWAWDDTSDSGGGVTLTCRVYAGATYQIVIDGEANSRGSFTLTGTAATGVPANDDIVSAQIIGTDVEISGDTTFATKEVGEDPPLLMAGPTSLASVWYAWVAPTTGLYEATTAGSTIDTLLGVHRISAAPADPSNSFGLISNNDQRAPDPLNPADLSWRDARGLFYAVSGTLYHIMVAGSGANNSADIQNVVGPWRGPHKLRVRAVPDTRPAHDNRTGAPGIVLPPVLNEGQFVTRQADNTFATREAAEWFIQDGMYASERRDHYPQATVWWRFTPPYDFIAEVSASAAAPLDPEVTLYDDAGALLARKHETTHPELARLQYPVKAGLTYYIQVGTPARNSPGFYPNARGLITLRLGRAPNYTVVPFGSVWEYLASATDPAGVDPDFHTTWYQPSYNGPAFASGNGLISFGGVDFQNPPGTALPNNTPVLYVRKVLTLTEPLDNAVALIVADDGGHLYLDGVRIARIVAYFGNGIYNFTTTSSVASAERMVSSIPLGRLGAGTHVIAMSVHNANATSSDIGFDMSIRNVLPDAGNIQLAVAEACATFENTEVGETIALGEIGGPRLGFRADAGEGSTSGTVNLTLPDPSRSYPLATQPSVVGQNCFRVTGAPATLRSGAVALANATVAHGVMASFEVLANIAYDTVPTAVTTFEDTDSLSAWLEGSPAGGGNFTALPGGQVLFTVSGGTPDLLTHLFQRTSAPAFTRLATPAPVVIPPGIAAVRIAISAQVNSTSEFLYFDNLCLQLVDLPTVSRPLPEEGAFPAIGMSNVVPNFTLQLRRGSVYELLSGSTLTNWSRQRLFTAEDDEVTLPANLIPATRRQFWRVRRWGSP
jgi:hypothetical protein